MDLLFMFIEECHNQKQSNAVTAGSKKPVFLQAVSFHFHSFGSKVICTVVLGGIMVYHIRVYAWFSGAAMRWWRSFGHLLE